MNNVDSAPDAKEIVKGGSNVYEGIKHLFGNFHCVTYNVLAQKLI